MHLLAVMNVGDKVSRPFNSGSGTSTKFTSALSTRRSLESSRLDPAVACGTEQR